MDKMFMDADQKAGVYFVEDWALTGLTASAGVRRADRALPKRIVGLGTSMAQQREPMDILQIAKAMRTQIRCDSERRDIGFR